MATAPAPVPAPVVPKESTGQKFVHVLDNVGSALKKFFASPVTVEVAEGGLGIADIAFPALAPLFNGISNSIAKAQALAQAANVTGDTTAQVTALAVQDAQVVFNTYQASTGTTLETAQQQAIVAGIIALLKNLPAVPAVAA